MSTAPVTTPHVEGELEGLVARGAFTDALIRAYDLYGDRIGRFAMAQLGARADAEEAVQEVFVGAHQSIAQFRGEAPLRAWLFGIARHVCAKRLEARVRQATHLALVHDAGEHGDVPEDVIQARQRALYVRRVLATLKPSERDAVLLRYDAELSYREIATVTGTDEATIRKRVSRALERMRQSMEQGV